MRRLVSVVLLCLAMAGVAAAADVTFVLTNGERHSGTLVYHRGTSVGLISNGRERSYPVSQVAAIIYNDSNPAQSELDQLSTSDNPPELERHMLVLRTGRVLHGKVYHWNPDSVVFDTTAGRDTYNANDVARLYLNGPPARRVFRAGEQQATVAAGQSSVRVEANQRWTDTGLLVRKGERIAFDTGGTISFGKDATAGPDGNKDHSLPRGYPVPNMSVGGLIARVGNGAPFPIGSTASPIDMPGSGRLMLGINDNVYEDNSGAFDVNVSRK